MNKETLNQNIENNVYAYIPIKEIAEAKGLKSTRSLRLEINKPESRYVSREVKVNGGTSYEILFSSLEPELQDKLRKCETKSTALVPLNYQPPIVTDKARLTANHRINIVKSALEYRKKYKTQKEADFEFLDLYNTGLYLPKAYEFLGSISIGTLRRYIQSYKKSENIESLIPQYKISKQGEYNGILDGEMKKILLTLLLHQNRFNFNKAIKLTKEILIRNGYKREELPCDLTFKRYAEHFKKNNYAEWILKREGIKAYHDKVEPYIERDISKIEVGDVIIADGHVLNFQVINPFTGKPTRATLVGFLDWKSTALVGYEIMMTENTQCIASALRNAILNLGLIPKVVYQDNGKAFKANYFTNLDGITGLFVRLGITPIFAQPYNAKAKPIERLFREMQDSFERLLPSFVGSCIDNQPAYTKRNEKIHKKHHNNYVPTIEQVIELLNCWLGFHYSRPCKNVEGKSIGEVLESGKGDGVDLSILDDLMMVSEIKKIGRNGIRFLKSDYYDESLYGLRIKVVIKYSLFDLSEIKVYDTNGKFICIAKRMETINPLANYTGDAKDIEEFKQKIKQQKRLEQQTVKKYFAELKKDKIGIPLLEDNYSDCNPIDDKKLYLSEFKDFEEDNNPPKFHNRYEKYDYLKKKDTLTLEEENWICNYERLDEFQLIYSAEGR